MELSEELVEEVERVFFLFLLLVFLSSESDPPVVFFMILPAIHLSISKGGVLSCEPLEAALADPLAVGLRPNILITVSFVCFWTSEACRSSALRLCSSLTKSITSRGKAGSEF